MSEHGVIIEDNKNNLRIRSATIKDVSILNSWWNDGSVMAHAGFPNGLNQSVEETKECIKNNETKISQVCIIEAESRPIGEMSFHIGQGYAEIGIKLCVTEYQNIGLGTKLLYMLIEFLFHDVNLNNKVLINKIILDTNLKNVRAQHVYEKIGFTKLAIHSNAWKDQLGNFQSSVEYELTREQYENGVRWIIDQELKETIARNILADLPEWFGLPESTENYVKESKEMPFFSYFKDGQHVGFIVLKETSEFTAEIFVMGVLKQYQRSKIGYKLLNHFIEYAKNKGYEFIQVKTVDAGHYEEYDRTRLFYEKMGFKKFECFPTLWDEWNPCLVMVQSI